jgi:hypothetical protein
MCKATSALVICGVCSQKLHFVLGRGFLHPNQAHYCVKCVHCSHMLTGQVLLSVCPSCGRPTAWTYDHASVPVKVAIND